ncbi:DUF4183 domain-containing protein [Sporosarcina thermotolerans]|uniref:DUF4183 domain-containing protein n=1 Tax=Sporosarcina thermotolerans TaxID=633404 RepID=A0AAW9A6W0_9BACL|nr:DUF4183 domain-containing protein [Sporosarcina thermotolerans]MDW0115480.1 DUF4183 domain-containing protein [Sporosarcina thermotolerans]
MNKINPRKFNCNYCCENRRFYWPRIIASTTPSVPFPPVIVPDQAIIPTINRYFYIVTEDINLTNGATLPANLFTDDNSNPITEFTIYNPNGYVNIYINAMMQEGGIYSVTPDALTIEPVAATIFAGTPIIIESLGFSTAAI